MTTGEGTRDWPATARTLRATLAERAAAADEHDAFVADNYPLMKEAKLFSALVPAELGGGGATHPEMCAVLRELARGCASTALALSMHSHLVAAAVWRHRRGQPGRALLEKVAGGELVLVSTGARDWVESNGTATQVDGGYRVSGYKAFASGCPAGDLAITSARFEAGNEILHFAVPLDAPGVRIDETWRTMGMRGTGSHGLVFDDVFVPDQAIAMRRPASASFPVAFNVIVGVASPLIMSVYVGLAEAAAELARDRLRGRDDDLTAYLVGEMENALATAQIALASMIALADDYAFEPSMELGSAVLVRKTLIASAVRQTADKALEAVGGPGFFRKLGLERLLRDAHAAQFHPLTEKRQHLFTGRVALGLAP